MPPRREAKSVKSLDLNGADTRSEDEPASSKHSNKRSRNSHDSASGRKKARRTTSKAGQPVNGGRRPATRSFLAQQRIQETHSEAGSNLSKASFKAEPETAVFDGLLFDMDGTIVDSTEAIIKHWYELGKKLGVDPEEILATSHGRRSIDTLQLYDPTLANWEYIPEIEGLIPKRFGKDAVEIPGSRALIETLDRNEVPWMIVTSATKPLIVGWLDRLKMKHPTDMVVAEDVSAGKPDPTCYLLGRKRLGLSEQANCLVLEDSPSGVRAGKAAGFKVVGLATTHRVDQLKDAGADWIVQDMNSVSLASWDSESGKVSIQIAKALVD